MANMDKRESRNLCAELRETPLRIPNLGTILSPMAAGSNPQYEMLVERMKPKIDEIIKDPRVRKEVDNMKPCLFASSWWPNSTIECQEAMVLLGIFYFVWDDVFDGQGDAEACPSNMDDVYEKTIQYAAYHLGLTDPSMEEPAAPTAATALLRPTCQVLHEQVSVAQCQRFFDEIKYYVNNCAVEYKYLSRGVLPSVDNYWRYRLGATAVSMNCALAEFMIGIELPDEFFEMPEVKVLWTEANRIAIVVNDLISLKKEMAAPNGGLHSLVPVTMQETGKGRDSVVADVVEQMKCFVDTFTKAAQALLSAAAVDSDPDLKERVAKYIEVIEFNTTGHYYWSLGCVRYGMAGVMQSDGSFVITL